ncbi:MAG: hypothetical protein Aurels2KO_31710 [Aureliella sp.]
MIYGKSMTSGNPWYVQIGADVAKIKLPNEARLIMFVRLLFFAVAFACCVHTAPASENRSPTYRDVEYAKVGDRSLLLDIYFPTKVENKKLPLVVWIHGGAWRAGSKAKVPVTRWLDEGFAIASVEYRLSPEARFPAQVHDIKAAIRFLRQSASKYQLDEERFVIAGASAGGHLAALVGVTNEHVELEGSVGDVKESSRVQAIVSFYGASNLETILSQSTEHGLSVRVPALKLLLGGLPSEVTGLARLASPVRHVDTNDPPLLLIHGDADPQMPPEQSDELHARYKKYGLRSELFVVEGGEHGGSQFYTQKRLASLASLLKESLRH